VAKITLEALNAKYGDSLLLRYEHAGKKRLWIIDGGPAGTWKNHLRPRLEALRGRAASLTVDLAMLSHVDDDHVNGILQMTGGIAEKRKGAATWLDIKKFWHNSFADLAGGEAKLQAKQAQLAGAAAPADAGADLAGVAFGGVSFDTHREGAVLASIGQGRRLRDYLTKLALDGNAPFGGTLTSASGKKPVDGVAVTVVGPIASRLAVFRHKWAEAATPAALASLFRDDLDESPTNLASIVLLLELQGKNILLTGDARGDDVLDGFKDAGLGAKLPMKLDVLKVPHHGSDRNITEEFLKAFPADHYIVSADGTHGNPDKSVLRAIAEVRGADRYDILLTNDVAGVRPLLKQLQKGRNFAFAIRPEAAHAISVEL
jgi:beta-lactamase superfamily II metal-dependent hydrolase